MVTKKVIEPFLYNYKLKFNELQKATKLRSNKLSYYLKRLVKEGTLEKRKESYILSEESVPEIPFISKKQSLLSAVLVLIQREGKVFLIEREKRPFKGKLSLPGGRILAGESIKEAAERISKKFGAKAKFRYVNSVSLEHVKKKGEAIHSFLLILVTATTDEDLDFVDPDKVRNIISSDYWLIKNRSEDKIKIDYLVSKD